MTSMQDTITLRLQQLGKIPFRRKHGLCEKDCNLVSENIEKVVEDARSIIWKRIGAAFPLKDGSQTPYKGHPVFVAMHACATCCRGCLQKWHNIPKGAALTENQVDFIVELMKQWLEGDAKHQHTLKQINL